MRNIYIQEIWYNLVSALEDIFAAIVTRTKHHHWWYRHSIYNGSRVFGLTK